MHRWPSRRRKIVFRWARLSGQEHARGQSIAWKQMELHDSFNLSTLYDLPALTANHPITGIKKKTPVKSQNMSLSASPRLVCFLRQPREGCREVSPSQTTTDTIKGKSKRKKQRNEDRWCWKRTMKPQKSRKTFVVAASNLRSTGIANGNRKRLPEKGFLSGGFEREKRAANCYSYRKRGLACLAWSEAEEVLPWNP